MTTVTASYESVSPWWRSGVLLAMILGFSVLIGMTVSAYQVAPPIPEKIVAAGGTSVFTGADISAGQQVFLKYGLMENGTIWGHGAYLGPDFSAEYLHTLGLDAAAAISGQLYGKPVDQLSPAEKAAVEAQVAQLLKENRYDPATGELTLSDIEAASFQKQITKWTTYFSQPANNAGLQAAMIEDPQELRQLTAFFAWTAWASVANRPDRPYSYTNNFPYDPLAGNRPTTDAFFWSALSLITLLGGTALILFAFGRFNYLGWKGKAQHIHPVMVPGGATEAQKATIKYFLLMGLLFLAQVFVGGA